MTLTKAACIKVALLLLLVTFPVLAEQEEKEKKLHVFAVDPVTRQCAEYCRNQRLTRDGYCGSGDSQIRR